MNKEEIILRLKENPLDRERWIEAGKGLGWGAWACMECGFNGRPDPDLHHDCGQCTGKIYAGWHYYMHCLADHLAEGNDIESFFKQLKSK